MGPTKKLTSIDSTIGKNSKAEMDNQLTSQTSQENEKFKNKTRDGITRRNAILRKVKEWPPINEPGMTDKLTDSTNGLKKIPKPLPDLPHSGLNLKVRQRKPLPPVPTMHHTQPQIHSQVQVQFQPQPQPQPQPRLNFKAIPIKNLPVTEMNKQIESFRDEMDIPKWKTWLMPAGDTRETLIEMYPKSIDKALEVGYCWTGRDHIISWDTKRAV
jgi:hypothetical protein